MRHRLIVIFLCGLSLSVPGAATAYPWPVRPFDRQHPIRANFGDPRTVFDLSLYKDGVAGPGAFHFHNGIDISAPDDTAVYPVLSGIVRSNRGETVTVRTSVGRTFQYVHVIPLVTVGERVIASWTTLGYIMPGYGHVHLTELRGTHVWNPLAKGGISPYRDDVAPTVRAITIRQWDGWRVLDPHAVCGRIALLADAFDTQSIPVAGAWSGFPVSPALVRWSLTGPGRSPVRETAADFRSRLPSERRFWRIYARWTFQNTPRFGRQQYRMPGLFEYALNKAPVDTRELGNHAYRLTVYAQDIRGNGASFVTTIDVRNDPHTESGCAPELAPTPPPPPPTTTTTPTATTATG